MGSRLYRRGDTWYCWGYDAHGNRWRESTKQRDRKAAEIVSREIARRRATASTQAAPITLHGALVMVGEADVRAGRSEAVAQILRQKGRQLVAHFGAACDLRALTRADLERYADARLSTVSRHTVSKELGVLRRACRVSGAPWSDSLMPDLGRVYVPRDRWLPWAEYLLLKAQLSDGRADYLDAYVYLGVRRSELHALMAYDVERDRVHVRGTKTDRADRWVPLSDGVRPVLERRAALAVREPLFPFWGNDRRDLGAACERAGIAPVSPNDLRRTFASWLANAGVSPLVTARLMGHTSTRMVERVYARLGVEIQADAVARLPVYTSEPEPTDKTEEVDVADEQKGPESS